MNGNLSNTRLLSGIFLFIEKDFKHPDEKKFHCSLIRLDLMKHNLEEIFLWEIESPVQTGQIEKRAFGDKFLGPILSYFLVLYF